MSEENKKIPGSAAPVSRPEDVCGREPGGVPLAPAIQGKLGSKLREQYGVLLSEPLPNKFTDLLDQLARSEEKS